MSKPLKLVIFDCDGTLVDSQHMIVAAMTAAYDAHCMVPPARDVLLSVVGLSLVEAFTELGKADVGFPVAAMAERYRDAFQAMRASGIAMEPLYPGAAEAVLELARRDDVLLGIATGKSQRGVRRVLGHYELLDHLITIKTADDAPSKPHPGMVIDAMREAGVDATNTVMVGDTEYDVRMARGAGARAIGVTWGYHPKGRLKEAGANAVIGAFGDLTLALAKIWPP